MSAPDTEKMTELTLTLNRRWGDRALRRGVDHLRAPDPLGTGYPELDHLLERGIPRPALVELAGRPTSGATSLALQLAARVQAEGGDATWIDLSRTFDPFRAEALGIVLKRLLLVRPGSVSEAMAIVEDTVQGSGSSLIVLSDTAAIMQGFQGTRVMARALQRLSVPLSHSTAIVIVLTPWSHTPPEAHVIADYATLRLGLHGRKLLFQAEQWIGFNTTVTITKHKTLAGRSTVLTTLL
jgi:RecA/RadA recombinase